MIAVEAKKFDGSGPHDRHVAMTLLRGDLAAILGKLDDLEMYMPAVHIQTALEALDNLLPQD